MTKKRNTTYGPILFYYLFKNKTALHRTFNSKFVSKKRKKRNQNLTMPILGFSSTIPYFLFIIVLSTRKVEK